MTREQTKQTTWSALRLLTLGSLLALGSTSSAQTTNRLTSQPALTTKASRAMFGPLQMMKQSLGLTDEQAQKLEPVIKEQQAKLAALRQDATLSRKEKVAKQKEMRDAMDAKLKSILTPDQAAKWQAMKPARQPRVQPPQPAPAK